MSKWFVVLLMFFCHVLDDYRLQGVLSSMKQKEWWKENYPQNMYKYDYIVALIMHSINWSFLIMLPIAIYNRFNVDVCFVVMFILNTFFHVTIDNLKANSKKINLVIDQTFHVLQIAWTALVFLSK